MTEESIEALLEARAPGAWELYRKQGASHELARSAAESRASSRHEEGCAARWWDPAPRFAAAGSVENLVRALTRSAEPTAAPGQVPEWPTGVAPAPGPFEAPEAPDDLFDELARLVAAESRGEATLAELSVRRGRSLERVVNAQGLDVAWSAGTLTGHASAVGRRGARSCEARALVGCTMLPALM